MTVRPNRVADTLEAAAKALRQHGTAALAAADERLAIGYPTRTLGDGTPRGTNELTSTESAADRLITHGDPHLDRATKLPIYLDLLDQAGSELIRLITDTLSHADPDSSVLPKQAGAGHCERCTRWTPGSASDRLRAGLCDGCRKAWERAGKPDRHQFILHYKPALGELAELLGVGDMGTHA